jgi:hypothetical protein
MSDTNTKFAYRYADPTITTSAQDDTPFLIYNTDQTFLSESVDVCKWTARRLGFPVMEIEMPSSSIYACFEEAISEYSLHINNYNIRNWMWDSYGSEDRISGSLGTEVKEPHNPNMGMTITLSEQYGQAIGIGGNIDMKRGYITLVNGEQDYNLQTLWANVSESSGRLMIHRVFNDGMASMTRYYDPYGGNYDQRQMLDMYGFGGSSPAVSFVMRPISYDIIRAQSIEINDKVRKSAYSFEITNNNLRIFPLPTTGDSGSKIWFEYYLKSDMQTTTSSATTGKTSNPSNAPYKFITYNSINASGRQWIRKYTLALSKELLGIIRSKYSAIPIPDQELQLDGESLKAEGREEKSDLAEELKEFLESVSLNEKARKEAEDAEALQQIMNKIPLLMYVDGFIPFIFLYNFLDWGAL